MLYLLLYLIFINGLSAYMMYADKQRSIRKTWRVPESNLFFLCISGGFLGTYLVMKYARHKTKHWQFSLAAIFSSMIWLLILPGLYWFIHNVH